MTATRIYLVDERGASVRLVEASSAAQAIRHVVRHKFTAHAATPKAVATLMARGIVLEQATDNEIEANAATTKQQTTHTHTY